jgi:hypothetical protein
MTAPKQFKSKDDLQADHDYLLVHVDPQGFYLPEDEWTQVRFTKEGSLVDLDGDTWTEELYYKNELGYLDLVRCDTANGKR